MEGLDGWGSGGRGGRRFKDGGFDASFCLFTVVLHVPVYLLTILNDWQATQWQIDSPSMTSYYLYQMISNVYHSCKRVHHMLPAITFSLSITHRFCVQLHTQTRVRCSKACMALSLHLDASDGSVVVLQGVGGA